MAREDYAAQVALLVRVLPYVAKEEKFALKGGTAINLFYRDLPRLSVDIDLTYLPIKDRAESLVEINDAMDRIAAAIKAASPAPKRSALPAVAAAPRVRSPASARPKSKSKPPPSPAASCMIRNNAKSPKPSRRRSDMRR